MIHLKAVSDRACQVLPFTGARRPYEFLMPGEMNRNRKLTSPGGTKPARKEAFMLDLAFIVLGFAVIALMGPYAVGLRQL